MTGVLEFTSTGEYMDERLYLLSTIERLEKKQDELIAALGGSKETLTKYRADLNEAHGRIRCLLKSRDELQKRVLRIEVKSGSIATLAGLLAAGAIEALRRFFFNK